MKQLPIERIEKKDSASSIGAPIILFDHLTAHDIDTSDDLHNIGRHAVILLLRGTSKVNIDGEFYEMSAGDLFVCRPQQMMQRHWCSDDLEFIGVASVPDFALRNLSAINPNAWDIKYFLERHPLIHLTPDEAEDFELFFRMLKRKMEQLTPSTFSHRLLQSLFTSFFLQIACIIHQHNVEVRDILFTSGEAIFHRFIDILEKSYPRERSVEYYAERLCITPKYLSAVCKKVCGKTALHIIREYVIADIRHALMQRDKSIKEISFELKFPNISFFGKYVKDYMGESPRFLRRKLLGSTMMSKDDSDCDDCDEASEND